MIERKGIILDYSLFGAEHKQFYTLADNNIIYSFFAYNSRKTSYQIEDIDFFNVVDFGFLKKNKKAQLIKLRKIEENKNIKKRFINFILTSIFFEMIRKTGAQNYSNIFNISISFLHLINEKEIKEKIEILNYLIFIFSFIIVNTGILHLNNICKKCNKILKDFIYVSIEDPVIKCKLHRNPYSYGLPVPFIQYFYILKKNNFITPIFFINITNVEGSQFKKLEKTLETVYKFLYRYFVNYSGISNFKSFKFLKYLF